LNFRKFLMAGVKSLSIGQTLNALRLGTAKALMRIPQGGTLEARRISSGVVFYWRFTEAGTTDRLPIGAYDSKASPRSLTPTAVGYSVEAAARAAEALAQAHRQAVNSNRGGYRQDRAQQETTRRLAKAEADARKGKTLKSLLADYCDHMELLQRRSHVDARSIFRLHVFEPWPSVSEYPACDVTSDDVIAMLRRLHQVGHGRTGNKLRAYLMAAYNVAAGARSLASIPEHFKAYHIVSNPVHSTRRDTASDKADKNPLSADEIRKYWKLIDGIGGVKGVALRLHLLSGGQRIEQIVNVKRASFRDGCITIMDAKGRPGKGPRVHTVPLLGRALKDVKSLEGAGEWLLSTDGGKTHLAATTLADWAKDVAGDQIVGFQMKRLRSGVETLLAAAGVSRETRGHLQSHGVQGVQTAHYDAHDYLPEKRATLEKLHTLLEDVKPAKVAPHRKRPA
jgi:integrase